MLSRVARVLSSIVGIRVFHDDIAVTVLGLEVNVVVGSRSESVVVGS